MVRRLALLALLGLALAPAPVAAADTITVASKIDTEGGLLGNLIATALAKRGLAIVNESQLGPTEILRAAILAGQIDIYPEYTGDGAIFFSREGDPVWRDAARGYDTVKRLDEVKNGLIWLTPAPANNGWAIAVRQDLAQARHLMTLEDFAHAVAAGWRVKLAASAEFVESAGALPAFEAAYGFTLGQSQLLILAGGDTAATLRAAAEGTSGVNAAMAYATDGPLAALHLAVLTDDRHAQIVYEPAPVVRRAVLARHPEIRTILDPIFRSLTLATLQRLNARIAVEGEAAKTVAASYLAARGFDK